MKRSCPYEIEDNKAKKIKLCTYYPANMNILVSRYMFAKHLPLVDDIINQVAYTMYYSDMICTKVKYLEKFTTMYFHHYEPIFNVVVKIADTFGMTIEKIKIVRQTWNYCEDYYVSLYNVQSDITDLLKMYGLLRVIDNILYLSKV